MCLALYFFIAVPLFNSEETYSYPALLRLESAGISVLAQLKETKKLNDLKKQAGFNLKLLGKHSLDDPVVHYMNSWLYDNSQRELTRKPTWRNFIQVLKEIDLGELAKEMEDFLTKTTPLEGEQANQSGILLTIICLTCVYNDNCTI